MNNSGISVSLLKEAVCLETFEEYASANIFNMEFNTYDEKYEDIEWEKLRKLSEKTGVKVRSLHLPFVSPVLDISSLDAAVRKRTIEVNAEYMKRGAAVGIEIFVLHPSLEPIADDIREERILFSMESLKELAVTAKKEKTRIAVENLPRTCLGRDSDEILRLTSADESLGVCFDTNHLLTQPISDFITNVGHKIITTHISDYDFIDERHLLPGEGKINWKELINKLDEVGYAGVYNYEVARDSTRYITRPRKLTYNDFYDNYRSILWKR